MRLTALLFDPCRRAPHHMGLPSDLSQPSNEYTKTSYSENREGSCWTNPVCRSQARWQHGPCSTPFPHVCLCKNTWNWMEKCWDWSLHGTICYRRIIVSWRRQTQRTSSQRLPFTRAYSSGNSPMPICWWWSIHICIPHWLKERSHPYSQTLWMTRAWNAHRARGEPL